ncbi:MAG: hypothetical protein GEU92_14315 [Alphaproteobacteria bacterium]|nr:hypothetical protein [Alphaproteobacteria bacterium]
MAYTEPLDPAAPPPDPDAETAAARLRGMAYMLASTVSISGMNGSVQYLSHSMHVFEVAFFRQVVGRSSCSASRCPRGCTTCGRGASARI